MKRRRILCLAGIVLLLVLGGCQSEKEPEKGPFLFFTNAEGTGLTRVSYTRKSEETEDAVQEVLDRLTENPESIEMKSPFSREVKVENAVLEDKALHLYMNDAYGEMDEVEEVLLRAALVQSLTQIPAVEMVDIFTGEKPLMTKSGEKVGYMTGSSFVKDTGTALKSYQHTTLTLFFANKEGDGLISEKTDVRYFSNISTEKLVLEQLAKGPQSGELSPVLSSKVKVLNISLKDGICYVNFSKEFLEPAYDAKPEVVIYSIVNSLISNCSVSRVQISVEGESSVKFQETVSLAEPFDRNIELVEKD